MPDSAPDPNAADSPAEQPATPPAEAVADAPAEQPAASPSPEQPKPSQPAASPTAASPATASPTAASPAAASQPYPPQPMMPAPRRRFPWIPVLVVVIVLQLIGSGVLLALLIGAGTQVVRANDTVAEQEEIIRQQQQAVEAAASERDEARQELASTEAGLDTALDYATVYESCLAPLFAAYDAWDDDDVDHGNNLFDQAWATDGPCWDAVAYLAGE